MASCIFHIIHVYELYKALSEETREKMPEDALKCMILGAVIPDMVEWTDKCKTHFYIEHPVYGEYYLIPDIKKCEEHFLVRDPTRLGVLAHLRYDLDHIENILLTYFIPIEGDVYMNTKTGRRINGLDLWGCKSQNVYGQLYMLYDLFNDEMTKLYTNIIAAEFGQEFEESKEGFLSLIKWLFGDEVPISGVNEMDQYRRNVNLYTEIEGYFKNDGAGCTINIKPEELLEVVKSSATTLAKQTDALYAV